VPDRSPFQKALTEALASGKELWKVVRALEDSKITTADDAQAVCDAIKTKGWQGGKRGPLSDERTLLGLLQRVSGVTAGDVIRREVMPEIVGEVERSIEACPPGAKPSDDTMFMLKLIALYAIPQGVELIARAIHKPVAPGDFMWCVILGLFAGGHPQAEELVRQLSDPLPGGFAGVAFLDTVNRMALKDELRPHAFDRPAGHAMLEAWLRDSDPGHFSYAHSATASLPFISAPARNSLLALAMDHSDPGVQMEAAWASAKLGNESGVKMLARFAADTRYGKTARRYLEEMGREDAIPEIANDPDFAALAEMSNWLAHPSEFGRLPDGIELFDTRELYWPPTDDRRSVWLLKYTYKGGKEDGSDEVGLGMVGSVTFALFSESSADLSAEDAYALHCCWELQMNKDARAPEKRTIEAGRRILGQYQ